MSGIMFFIMKGFHLIFVITWFAGLFYMPRLFIYQTEANSKAEPDRSILINQFKLMSRRLWYMITWPSAILALLFGSSIMHLYFQSIWFWIKMALVLALYIYHFIMQSIYSGLTKDKYKYTSYQLRIFNEVGTVFLVAIVFLAILKDAINYFILFAGIVSLLLLLYLGIRAYRRHRERQKVKSEKTIANE
jgi:putative membrane protein